MWCLRSTLEIPHPPPHAFTGEYIVSPESPFRATTATCYLVVISRKGKKRRKKKKDWFHLQEYDNNIKLSYSNLTSTTMKFSRTNSGYWPDDLPCPSSNTTTVEVHYLQCGCTLQDTSSDSLTAFYGDVESWSPAPSTQLQNRSSDSTNTHPRSASPASSDRSRSQSVEAPIVRRVVDSWFCEKATCNRSKVFSMFFFFFFYPINYKDNLKSAWVLINSCYQQIGNGTVYGKNTTRR